MEQGKHKEALCQEAETIPPINVSRDSDCWAYMHIHICKKVNPNIYFDIFFYFSIRDCLFYCSHMHSNFSYIFQISFLYYSSKNHVNVQHGTSDLIPFRRHVPVHRAEPNTKRPLMTSQAATRYMRLKPLYQLSLLSD